jgi:uncharacterized membrane protein
MYNFKNWLFKLFLVLNCQVLVQVRWIKTNLFTETHMFGPNKLLMLALVGIATGFAWLLLYDNDKKKWKSPAETTIAVGYVVMAACMLGAFLVITFQPLGESW